MMIADALRNLAKAPNLQCSNSSKNLLFSSMDLKLCTLIDLDRVNNISNFHFNYIYIKRDMALQSC